VHGAVTVFGVKVASQQDVTYWRVLSCFVYHWLHPVKPAVVVFQTPAAELLLKGFLPMIGMVHLLVQSVLEAETTDLGRDGGRVFMTVLKDGATKLGLEAAASSCKPLLWCPAALPKAANRLAWHGSCIKLEF
jgi:hypothetical protein